MKENDLVLKTVTRIVIFIILTFGFYLFLAVITIQEAALLRD